MEHLPIDTLRIKHTQELHESIESEIVILQDFIHIFVSNNDHVPLSIINNGLYCTIEAVLKYEMQQI